MNLELRLEFIKSLKRTESGLFINLDRAAGLTFIPGSDDAFDGIAAHLLPLFGPQAVVDIANDISEALLRSIREEEIDVAAHHSHPLFQCVRHNDDDDDDDEDGDDDDEDGDDRCPQATCCLTWYARCRSAAESGCCCGCDSRAAA